MRARDIGIGLRPPHYEAFLEDKLAIDFVEVVTENFLGLRGGSGGGRPLEILGRVRAETRVALHGVSLNIGSTDLLDEAYLGRLATLVEGVDPFVVSDHLCWSGVRGENLHDLLPLPATEEAVRHVVARVQRVQERLGRRILLENVSSYLQFAADEMPECDFLAEVARRSGCGVLLDVNNIYVSAANHGFDPIESMSRIPRSAVGQMHLAGHTDAGTHLIDTHDHPVAEAVWGLFAFAVARFGPVPTLIEWDDKLPSLSALVSEALGAGIIQEVVDEESRARTRASRDAGVDARRDDRSTRRRSSAG